MKSEHVDPALAVIGGAVSTIVAGVSFLVLASLGLAAQWWQYLVVGFLITVAVRIGFGPWLRRRATEVEPPGGTDA